MNNTEIVEVTEKTPIEIALEVDDEGYTTARKLYRWLELDKRQYSRWVKRTILYNPNVEKTEYLPLSPKSTAKGGRPTIDCKITANLAKKLSMATHSEKGEQARIYFLYCEKALQKIIREKEQKKTREKNVICFENMFNNTQSITAKSIYVFECSGRFKIGVSNNPERRMKDLVTGCPNINMIYKSAYIVNAYQIEKNIHDIFQEYCIGGEWFSFKNMEFLEKIKSIIHNEGITSETCQKYNKSTDCIKMFEHKMDKYINNTVCDSVAAYA